MTALLEQGIGRLGLECPQGAFERVEAYLAELGLWNKHSSLVKGAGDELVVKHLLDSLAAVPIIAGLPHSTIADVGSGAGFPGIPLALFIEEAEFSLIERSARRVAFLRNVVTLLDLGERVQVIGTDFEEIRERFAIVTFRAFGNLASFASRLLALVDPAGAVVAYKGRRAVVEREMAEVGKLVRSWELRPVQVPWLEEERTIVLMRP